MSDILPLFTAQDNFSNLLNLLLLRRREQIRTRNDFKNQAIVDPEHSSFSILYHNGSDEDFINILGLNKEGFHLAVFLDFTEKNTKRAEEEDLKKWMAVKLWDYFFNSMIQQVN